MPLRPTMPARDPERAKAEPEYSRKYAASRGGYAQTPPKPIPGTPRTT